jgi:hypothetical protein
VYIFSYSQEAVDNPVYIFSYSQEAVDKLVSFSATPIFTTMHHYYTIFHHCCQPFSHRNTTVSRQ